MSCDGQNLSFNTDFVFYNIRVKLMTIRQLQNYVFTPSFPKSYA
jgi:hypothetical protein